MVETFSNNRKKDLRMADCVRFIGFPIYWFIHTDVVRGIRQRKYDRLFL